MYLENETLFWTLFFIACLGLSMAAPHVVLLHETEGPDVDLGKLIFKPNPGLFAEISDGAENQNHSEEPVAGVTQESTTDADAGESKQIQGRCF